MRVEFTGKCWQRNGNKKKGRNGRKKRRKSGKKKKGAVPLQFEFHVSVSISVFRLKQIVILGS